MEWNWATKAFISYDPYTDQRIDSITDEYETSSEIPLFLNSVVRRAKKLVGNAPLSEIISDTEMVMKIVIDAGVFLYGERLKLGSGRLLYPGQAGILRDYLVIARKGPMQIKYPDPVMPLDFNFDPDKTYIDLRKINFPSNKTIIPVERWPYFFGVFALIMAGQVVNLLWPTEEYRAVPPRYENNLDVVEPLSNIEKQSSLEYFVADALQAIGFGEGILLGEKYFSEKTSGGKRPSKAHEELYRIFIEWALSLPENHGFSDTEDAVKVGFKHLLNESEASSFLSKNVKDTTHRRLKEKLEDHCIENSIRYPFPRTRSKRNI